MKIEANTPDEYIDNLASDRKEAISKLRNVIKEHLPKGFVEALSYGMIGYVVPHSIFAAGYHCNPELPLPFINIASQKNFIALYHMGIYADKNLLEWFLENYPKHTTAKLDIGKSCIRFKKPELIPFELIGQLCEKMTPENWIDLYQSSLKK